MNPSFIYFTFLYFCFRICLSDPDNLQDTCPTSTGSRQTVFFNGFPCKNPANITASDFKSSALNRPGDTDNFLRSSLRIITAAELPGLNTLGLSISRTDVEVDGLLPPHSHPRATEMFFVSKGIVIAGFIDTKNKLFQKILREGDVFVIPRGLLHFCLNAGYEDAVVFSVLNSQNPGVVRITDAAFEVDQYVMDKIVTKIKSLSALETSNRDETLSGF